TQEYGVYAGTTANGSCTIPTASVARIGQDNDLSSNTQGAIGPNTAFGYYQPVTGQPVPSYTLASLPTSGTEGQRAYCMDCTLNSVAGVEVHWSASAAKWLSAGNIAASK
ncbi:hypothetical protein, partial [Asaia bogorensis]|uniref:hypothetical protein n=1 Tax=Asaia bogorensis TaxID=91915 RepID=UPI0013CF0D5B